MLTKTTYPQQNLPDNFIFVQQNMIDGVKYRQYRYSTV